MIPIRGRPFLEHQVRLLAGQGIHRFVFCLGHLAEQVMEHFGDGSKWGVSIEHSIEPSPLGTAGALKYADPLIEGRVLLLNGDTYALMDYQALLAFHQQQAEQEEAIGTVALMQVPDASSFGMVTLNENSEIVTFEEKAAGQKPGLVNTGVYVLEPSVLGYIADDRKVSLEREVLPTILSTERKLFGLEMTGSFVDIGTPDGYHRLEELLG
jgi:NDP-sugar pyrophosphorylase family protein